MDDIKGTLFKLTKTVTNSSGNFIKTTKLTVDLAGQEENLRNIYVDIGKKVHEIYAFGGSLGKFFDDKYRELEECEQRIKEMKDQISALKGSKICQGCGKMMDKNAEFCPKCGSKTDASVLKAPELMEPAPTPLVTAPADKPIVNEPPVMEIEAASVTIKCRGCSAENDANTKFCLSCGRLLS